jgi:hypothetical protein
MADLDHDYTAARTRLFHVGLSALLLLAAAACGDDDDNQPVTTSQAGAGAGASGLGGASGSALAGSGGSGVVMPEPVPCGSSMCYPRSNPLTAIIGMAGPALGNLLPTALPCCLDADTGACGTSMTMGGACEPPAIADSRCPGLDLGAAGMLVGGLAMSGCCLENQCGQDGMLFGRGCVENSQVMSMLSGIPLIGTLARVPPTLACDRPMEMKPTQMTPKDERDAGAEDAGH